MAKTMVPSFSAISIFTNTWSWLKGEGVTLPAKGALSAGPMAYGKILTTTGTNMAAYPGTAAAGADIAETGAFWTTTGATAGEVLLFVGVEASVFATAADAYARWQECAMIARLGLVLNWKALLERQDTAMGALALAVVFASGLFDAAILKRKDWACATWFLGLLSLTAWIAYSWTTASILAGAVVFASGLTLLVLCHRNWKTDARKPS